MYFLDRYSGMPPQDVEMVNFMQLYNRDQLNVTMQGMALTLVKGHEPTPYEVPS